MQHRVSFIDDSRFGSFQKKEFFRKILVVQQQPQSAVQRAFSKVDFSVSVSPRYGSWDGTNLFLSPGAKLPSYLDVQPGGAQQGLTGNS